MVMLASLQAARFPLGRIVATPGALSALADAGRAEGAGTLGTLVAAGQTGAALLARHATGDWGDVCAEDARANEDALRDGERILSAYRLTTGEKLYVITEWDRSATTVLLASEY